MTRVAVLHNIISPHVVPLFQRLARQPDIDLKVYFLAASDLNRRWQSTIGDSFRYTVLPHRAIRVGRRDMHTFFINPTVLTELSRDGFDVIVSAGWDSFAALASFAMCKLQCKPFVLWSGSTINEPSWRRTLTLPLVRCVVRGSDACIAYGTRAREYLVHLGARTECIHIAYNTVDVEWFRERNTELRPRRFDLRRQLGIADGPVVLYVGQLIERKGAQDLLVAHEFIVQQQPASQTVLVGYGRLEAELRRRVDDRQIPGVKIVGHVAIADLPAYYAVADVFALPSREEVWGLVLNEAAASSLPLVTTQVVGAAADLVIPDENGCMVPPASPRKLASALLHALADRERMGAASRKIVAGMTYEQNVRAIVAAIAAAWR
ncbi:MAG: glycosyltransferase family 4 protein [Chloroflexota bacterium]|nr:glycosyltransferase family 4 protein [Chloroflexota bacterium]